MGKGLQPLIAMETHVCPSLCLPPPRTDRQLAVSQPRITHTHTHTHTHCSTCLQKSHKHTHQGPDTGARTLRHTQRTKSLRQKSLSPTFVNSFVKPTVTSRRVTAVIPKKANFLVCWSFVYSVKTPQKTHQQRRCKKIPSLFEFSPLLNPFFIIFSCYP